MSHTIISNKSASITIRNRESLPSKSRQFHLVEFPVGMPTLDTFELAEVDLPHAGDGEVLVQNRFLSVDPYMRGRMINQKGSYVPPFELHKPLEGGCVGEVIESKSDDMKPGDHVLSMYGWRDAYVAPARELRVVDPNLAPLQSYLGALGMTGFTAYVGLETIGKLTEGETVFVSAASGAVGSIACQIAKIKGCRVVGSAGSDEKIAWLTNDLGVDAAFNYKNVENLSTELRTHCPDGIDVYFENVGGDHLVAALHNMNTNGRIIVCGLISQYNATERPVGPWNLINMLTKRLTMQGFIVSDHYDMLKDFISDMSGWIMAGQLQWKETIIEGFEKTPEAFLGLFSGQNTGKMIVKL